MAEEINNRGHIFNNKYKLISKLGSGSFGNVYKVEDIEQNGKLFAMKLLTGSLDLYLNESVILEKLRHHCLLDFVDTFIEVINMYIITELCVGGDLANKLNETKRLGGHIPLVKIIQWTGQLLLAVEYLHQNKVMHRDIKPGNIFLTVEKDNWVIKLGDFGIAKKFGTNSILLASTHAGTSAYMSPEIIAGGEDYDFKADVWSTGCVIYELITLEFFNSKNEYLDFKYRDDCVISDGTNCIKKLLRGMLQVKKNRRYSSGEIATIMNDCLVINNNFNLEKQVVLLKKELFVNGNNSSLTDDEAVVNSEGRLFNQIYIFVCHLKYGSFGDVFKVEDIEQKGKFFVMKKYKKQNEYDQEVAILQRLKHIYLIEFENSFAAENKIDYFIVTQFCEGGDLANKLNETKRLGEHIPLVKIIQWTRQLLFAVEYLHREKVLHRDIKPRNIFLTIEENIRLGEFGISQEIGISTVASNARQGTSNYMSPEVLKGADYDFKADVWSTGCVIYELITLEVFGDYYHQNKLKFTEECQVGDEPNCMKKLLRGMLQRDQIKRYSSAEILANDCLLMNDCLQIDKNNNLEEQIIQLKDELFSLNDKTSLHEMLNKPVFLNKKLLSGSGDNSIKLWDLNTGECLKTLLGHDCQVNCLNKLSDERIISASVNGELKIWNLDDDECLATTNAHNFLEWIRVISNDKIITCSCDKTINTWKIALDFKLLLLSSISLENIEEVNSIYIISDDKFLSCSFDKTVKLYALQISDLNSGLCLNTLKGLQRSVYYVKLISKNRIISCSWGDDSTIDLWDLTTGECLRTLSGHQFYVECVQELSNDKIVTCSNDATIKLWDLNTGECRKTLEGHTSAVHLVEVISDEFIVSCSSDKSIKVWSIETGLCLKTVIGHKGPINHIIIL